MLQLSGCKVFLCLEAVDMRKSYEGLSGLTQSVLKQNPLSGHLFVFFNKKGDRVKILYWHVNGLCLWQKRLEKGSFHRPSLNSETSQCLTLYQLEGLFQGINWEIIPVPATLSYNYT